MDVGDDHRDEKRKNSHKESQYTQEGDGVQEVLREGLEWGS